MDMFQVIKEIINNASGFEKHRNNNSIIQSLQILSATDDLSIFDTGTIEAAEFYSLLFDLLNHPSSESELVWCIVNVLQTAVRNPNACSALVHNYHFIHPLTTLLDAQLSTQRKLILLKLIQELSYGVIICWQEAHLPKLITILLDMITGIDSELITTALGVMVNLCHKNQPVVYTLMNCVDIKIFLRTILNLQRKNIETSVQVCKLLMILNHLSHVPNEEILSFVRVSFLRIEKAFNCGNTILMRHIVDFFHDALESDHGKKVLLTYPKYLEEINNLTNTLSAETGTHNDQCVHQLLKFMQQLIDLELSVILPLFNRLTQCVLPLISVEEVAPAALELISTMMRQSSKTDDSVYRAICSSLENHLEVLVEMLHSNCRSGSPTSKSRDTLKWLLHLFREMAANPTLSTTIASTVDKEDLKRVLLPLMSENGHDDNHLFQQSVTAFYVEVLSFISELSQDDKEWFFLYLELLKKKQIMRALAVALYSGSYEVKKKILYLAGTTSFSKECLTVLSKCLTDLNQLFLFDPNSNNHISNKGVCFPQNQLEMSSSLNKTQRDSLNNLVEKLDDLLKKNQIKDASLAGIVELYNYKLIETRRAEHTLQSSLVAADSHRTQMSHRVSRLCAETNRLHQLLYSGHQTIEGSQMALAELREQLQSAQDSASSSHTKLKQLNQDLQKKSSIIKELNDEILSLKEKIVTVTSKTEEQNEVIEQFKRKTVLLEKENTDLQTTQSKLEEKLKARDESVLEKEIFIANKTSQIKSQQQEIGNLQSLIKGLENNLKEKEKEISAQNNQLVDLERMRKIIYEITGGKKSSL